MIAIFVIAASPIAFFKSVARLSFPALFNQIFVGAALLIVLYMTCHAAATATTARNDEVFTRASFLGTLSAVGGLSYFYVCHDMAVQVCGYPNCHPIPSTSLLSLPSPSYPQKKEHIFGFTLVIQPSSLRSSVSALRVGHACSPPLHQ
jgi:hypothetical protein